MFFDTVGHGINNDDDHHGKSGCPEPKKCGCGGDIVAQAIKLKNYGARVCIVGPNSCLDDSLYVVYAATVVKLTKGWLVALPDSQDLDQLLALKLLGQERFKAFEMWRKFHADDGSDELVAEFDAELAELQLLLARATLQEPALLATVEEGYQRLEKKYTRGALPGMVEVDKFGDAECNTLTAASGRVRALGIGHLKKVRDSLFFSTLHLCLGNAEVCCKGRSQHLQAQQVQVCGCPGVCDGPAHARPPGADGCLC